MRTSGAPDPLYVAARRALLDALEAVAAHLESLVLVGAQAVYLHNGDGDLQMAPHTTDADIAIDPARLAASPLIEQALGSAGFVRPRNEVGAWIKGILVEGETRPIVVDLLVPESLGGAGRRGARIPPHDKLAARKVVGLEGALVDRDAQSLMSLDSEDERELTLHVAGPAALLVAKAFKISERSRDDDHRRDKDALDVLRLLRAAPTDELVRRFGVLGASPVSRDVAGDALQRLEELFRTPRALGCVMAARAAGPSEDEETIRQSASLLLQRLIDGLHPLFSSPSTSAGTSSQ